MHANLKCDFTMIQIHRSLPGRLAALTAILLSYTATAIGAEPPFDTVEISESRFAEALSVSNSHQQAADTVTSEQVCRKIQTVSTEHLQNLPAGKAGSYNCFPDSPFEVYPILRFPFGVIACGVYKGFEEYDYWFFNESDYKFIIQTDSPLSNYVSANGYMATLKSHSYDRLSDISVYRLQNGDIKLVHKFADTNISRIEQACWGADALYLSGECATDGDDPDFIPTHLKLTLPQ